MKTVNGIVEVLDIKSDAGAGALTGFKFAVKDMFAVEGHVAGFGSPDWKNTHSSATRTAPVVQKLLAGGAHLVANTVCDELAFSLDGINVHYGVPLNPLAPDCIPGGSSSGPASVVAQGLVDFALGTDTAGSTRVPASYCGIWGLRPSHGAISLEGVLPLGPTFDTVGLLAGSLETLTQVAHALLPPDGENSTAGASGKTLILVSECFQLLSPQLQPPVMALAARVKELFAVTAERAITAEGLETLVKYFAAIRSVEAWQCHGLWYEKIRPNLSTGVNKRLLACRSASAEGAAQSRLYRSELQETFADLLQDTILCLPTTGSMPPRIDATAEALEENRGVNLRINSIASFLGLPQINIPLTACGMPNLPIGLSLVAAKGGESNLLRVAAELVRP
ncbi:MAG: amidase [Cyanobacteria bacterium SZAS TMP-1]|nr:amidase [Cyanobacteria bacterium SZAS TMP-1]